MRNFELLLKIECMKTANTVVHSCMDLRDTEENSAAAHDELGGRSHLHTQKSKIVALPPGGIYTTLLPDHP